MCGYIKRIQVSLADMTPLFPRHLMLVNLTRQSSRDLILKKNDNETYQKKHICCRSSNNSLVLFIFYFKIKGI